METALLKVKNDGEFLLTMDGSRWIIEAGDVPTSCTWIPTARIRIDEVSSGHRITNLEIGVSVNSSRVN